MIKLGSVPFVNAKPLVYPLEKGLVKHSFDITYEVPSILSKKLLNKDVDIGLIPVAELIGNNQYKVVKDISISSNGNVDSVILASKKDIKDIKTVAVDSRSQSSTALLKVILQVFNALKPEYYKRDFNESFFEEVDCGMIIGDSGLSFLHTHNSEYKIYDLGKLWTDETGLPFVYAVFAVNNEVDLGENQKALLDSKSIGITLTKEISEIESQKIGISTDYCNKYISQRIRYDLGKKEVEGILSFSKFLADLGISNQITEIDFY